MCATSISCASLTRVHEDTDGGVVSVQVLLWAQELPSAQQLGKNVLRNDQVWNLIQH